MINRIFNHLKVSVNSDKCIVKWSSGSVTKKNIGDVLNEYLFPKVFNRKIVNIRNVMNIGVPPVYSFIGSVLDNTAVKNLVVLGSGFKSESSKILIKPRKVIACRGPLSRQKLMDVGIDVPKIYGDPAILLPEYYNPEAKIRYKLGIIPHYMDKDLEIVKKWSKNPEVKVIDVFSSMETFVEDLKSCEFTISSSLHGIILSHAYGLPSGWVKLSDNLKGGAFKFEDYFQSLKIKHNPIFLDDKSTLQSLKKNCVLPEMSDLTNDLSLAFKNFTIN